MSLSSKVLATGAEATIVEPICWGAAADAGGVICADTEVTARETKTTRDLFEYFMAWILDVLVKATY